MERFKIVFCLGFDVCEAKTPSGFVPAERHHPTRLPLLGDLRLSGASAALRLGLVTERLITLGRIEPRYKHRAQPVNQAKAIAAMLVEDCGADPALVEAIPSGGSTFADVDIIKAAIEQRGISPEECAFLTNYYHVLRAGNNFRKKGLRLFGMPAEVAWLIESASQKEWQRRERHIGERYGERYPSSDIGKRNRFEIRGFARDFNGSYTERR